jgi:hypothetical protein
MFSYFWRTCPPAHQIFLKGVCAPLSGTHKMAGTMEEKINIPSGIKISVEKMSAK